MDGGNDLKEYIIYIIYLLCDKDNINDTVAEWLRRSTRNRLE